MVLLPSLIRHGDTVPWLHSPPAQLWMAFFHRDKNSTAARAASAMAATRSFAEADEPAE